MENSLAYLVYLVPLILIVAHYQTKKRSQNRQSVAVKSESVASGLTEPASLHPVIDPLKCVGCGSCVDACPENQVLGLINLKAELIAPSHCIGHGACATACPESAIDLVFGTETRGVEIPDLSTDFETSVPGIFIAGELGGMGLIRNAIEQGKQAMAAIDKKLASADSTVKNGEDEIFDVVIVGAGPAGIAAALCATEKKMKYVVVEQDSLGGTVAHFPRRKLVMTSPAKLPMVGEVKFSETSKEELLSFWQKIENDYDLNIRYHERMEAVDSNDGFFRVISSRGEYRCKSILMAIGRRGTPRKLDVGGEDHEKVSYRLLDPQQFAGRRVLVVGGGDSALEAAHTIAEEEGTKVVLSYRGESFNRAKQKNREKIDLARQRGNLAVLLNSQVRNISEEAVEIETAGVSKRIANDSVIVCAGGILPNALLENIGISVTTKYGTQ